MVAIMTLCLVAHELRPGRLRAAFLVMRPWYRPTEMPSSLKAVREFVRAGLDGRGVDYAAALVFKGDHVGEAVELVFVAGGGDDREGKVGALGPGVDDAGLDACGADRGFLR